MWPYDWIHDIHSLHLFHFQDPWWTCCGSSSLHWQSSLVSFSHSLARRQPRHSSRALQLPLQIHGSGQEEAIVWKPWGKDEYWACNCNDNERLYGKKCFKKHILSYSVLILTNQLYFFYFLPLKMSICISGGKTNVQLQLEGTQILVGSEMLMTMTKITTHIMEIQHNRCKKCCSPEENFDF